MEFTRTRGINAKSRCTNIGTYGSPLYCKCGCQTPSDGDQPDSLDNLSAEWRHPFTGRYVVLIRDGAAVGMIDPARKYISLDGNEYLGVKPGTRLSKVLSLPIGGRREKENTSAGSTLEETAAQEAMGEKIELMEMDERNKNHPGYCMKCHGFCYGDCEAN